MKEASLTSPRSRQSSLRSRAARAAASLAAGLVALLGAQAAAAQAVYRYTGHPFTFFSCGPTLAGDATMACSNDPAPGNTLTSYLATDSVTMTLTLDSPLPASMALTDVRSLPGFAVSMNDGHQTVTIPDAIGGFFAEVETDASGQISQWRFVLNTGFPNNGGVSTVNRIFNGSPAVHDQGVIACCDPTIHGDLAENFNMPGTWSNGAPSPAAATTSLINLLASPSLQLTAGLVASLTDKLDHVLASIQAGSSKQAINQLGAFVNAVQTAQKTNKISAQSAQTLVDAAKAITAMLSS